MKTLLKNATVVNVFTAELQSADVLIDGEFIVGVGDYSDEPVDVVKDLAGKYICPGFIDAHIHIESNTAGDGCENGCCRTEHGHKNCNG